MHHVTEAVIIYLQYLLSSRCPHLKAPHASRLLILPLCVISFFFHTSLFSVCLLSAILSHGPRQHTEHTHSDGQIWQKSVPRWYRGETLELPTQVNRSDRLCWGSQVEECASCAPLSICQTACQKLLMVEALCFLSSSVGLTGLNLQRSSSS